MKTTGICASIKQHMRILVPLPHTPRHLPSSLPQIFHLHDASSDVGPMEPVLTCTGERIGVRDSEP